MGKKTKSSSTGGRGRGPGPRNRRGRRGKHEKRSPFSGIQRDVRARYERISQRDRQGSQTGVGATGKLVSAPRLTDDGLPSEEQIEAVEFDAAEELPAAAAADLETEPDADLDKDDLDVDDDGEEEEESEADDEDE